MLLRNYLSNTRINYFIMLILFLFSSTLFSQIRDWDQLYTLTDRPVVDMKFSSIPGISQDGLLFALPGNDGGLAYFTNQDSLNIFSIASNLGAVSIAPAEDNNRIFCAFGCGSNSDGLYEFDVTLQEFELIDGYFFPHFIKKLSSGFYFGYGDNIEGGLVHSTNGDEWSEIEFFNSKNVTDIEENSDGTLFISAGNEIYIENGGSYTSLTTPSIITAIYARNYPNNDEIYIASGGGSYSDAVYRVEYENNEITSLTYICGLFQANSFFEYEDYLVVGCIDYFSNLFLVEPIENGQIQQIGDELGINEVYCFEFYPIYTHNFIVGTDIGVFLGTNLTTSFEDEINEINTKTTISNYPNPFNPSTTIEFSIQKKSIIELSIFNVKGQKIKNLVSKRFESGSHSLIWNGTDDLGNVVSSGIYYYIMYVNGEVNKTKKCLLLK